MIDNGSPCKLITIAAWYIAGSQNKAVTVHDHMVTYSSLKSHTRIWLINLRNLNVKNFSKIIKHLAQGLYSKSYK